MSSNLLEGQNLGKYRVLEPLGRGGMARVYRAYHPELDRYVAVKVLRSDLVEEQEFLARFRREARAVAGLRHPNIVQVFDFETRGDLYYMVMELLEGDTLHRRLDDYRAREERMPLGEAVRIALDLLDGLAYAHDEGMIHRDIKPANVLLTRKGEAVLTDFGIAQIVGGTQYTATGVLMGTLSYMAPEQGLEGHCDARSDVYSTGIVLYEMLTGEPPFDAETPLAILMKHVNDPLPLPRERVPDLPEPLERVVLKALAKRPHDRYAGAQEMAVALRNATEAAGLVLPARVSLPLSFTTPEAPAESVAILTGDARQKAVAAEAAAEDTDARLGEKLAAEGAASAEVEAKRSEVAPAGEARQQRPASRPVVERAQSARPSRPGLGTALLVGLGLIVAGNLLAVILGVSTNWWGVYGRGWPFELLLVGLGLALISEATGWPWLWIPAGLVLGNGYLMSFYAITGAWSLWTYLWPLELVIVLASVAVAVRLAGEGPAGRERTRRLAVLVKRPTLALAVVIMLLGMVFGS